MIYAARKKVWQPMSPSSPHHLQNEPLLAPDRRRNTSTLSLDHSSPKKAAGGDAKNSTRTVVGRLVHAVVGGSLNPRDLYVQGEGDVPGTAAPLTRVTAKEVGITLPSSSRTVAGRAEKTTKKISGALGKMGVWYFVDNILDMIGRQGGKTRALQSGHKIFEKAISGRAKTTPGDRNFLFVKNLKT